MRLHLQCICRSIAAISYNFKLSKYQTPKSQDKSISQVRQAKCRCRLPSSYRLPSRLRRYSPPLVALQLTRIAIAQFLIIEVRCQMRSRCTRSHRASARLAPACSSVGGFTTGKWVCLPESQLGMHVHLVTRVGMDRALGRTRHLTSGGVTRSARARLRRCRVHIESR